VDARASTGPVCVSGEFPYNNNNSYVGLGVQILFKSSDVATIKSPPTPGCATATLARRWRQRFALFKCLWRLLRFMLWQNVEKQ
jgi:hypothetical protein